MKFKHITQRKLKHKDISLQIRLGAAFLISVLLSACASGPLKAPCDRYATFCGAKTKINNW